MQKLLLLKNTENNLKKKIFNGNEKKYIIITDWIKNYLTKEAYMFAIKLENLGWEIIELSKIKIENIRKEKCIILCITYDDFDLSLLYCNNIFIIYKIDDLNNPTKIRQKIIINCDFIIGPYQYLFYTKEIIDFYPKINQIPNYCIPYSAVNKFYDKIYFNDNPIEKIFISGCIIKEIYPFRNFLATEKFKNYTEVLNHPSYNSYKHDIINDKFYGQT